MGRQIPHLGPIYTRAALREFGVIVPQGDEMLPQYHYEQCRAIREGMNWMNSGAIPHWDERSGTRYHLYARNEEASGAGGGFAANEHVVGLEKASGLDWTGWWFTPRTYGERAGADWTRRRWRLRC